MRLGGRDKGLIDDQGETFVSTLTRLLRPHCRRILLSCNRNLAEYAAIGDVLVRDQLPDFQGPFAGIYSAALQTDADFLLICPCDTPGLDNRFVERMLADLRSASASRVAHDGIRSQQLHLLLKRAQALSCGDYLRQGGRSVYDWLMPLQPEFVDFSDCADMFHNINTPSDLQWWQSSR